MALLHSDPAEQNPAGEGIACAGVTLSSQLVLDCGAALLLLLPSRLTSWS